ncbi:MAG: N-6 DNA methylase [Planctomycetaceae bacterium]
MSKNGNWLFEFGSLGFGPDVDGVVPVRGYDKTRRPPEEVAAIEKAQHYGATAVFFEAGREGTPPVPQAFIFVSDGPAKDQRFAETHKRLWSWGGVPLVYRVTRGLVQLFRCAHKAEFERNGEIVFRPFATWKAATSIATDPWWDAERLRNGTLWDDPDVCKELLSADRASHKSLITEVRSLNADLNREAVLPKHLRRKLLILSLLIAYLEERQVFETDFFRQFLDGANRFFEILANGPSLVALLDHLEQRFNGHVFIIDESDKEQLRSNKQLTKFARLIEGRREKSGQLTLWQRYSFADLPVELISHVYQLFVTERSTSIYTPPFLVRLMLSEVLSWERLDRLIENDEVILDPACGSGVFLVEAYKRLVLHWRSRNDWKRPTKTVLQNLLKRLHGIDIEPGAVELAAFSLCLGLCDALEPASIRASIRLFPELQHKTIHQSCFFEAKQEGRIHPKVGVIVGNPPFTSKLTTPGARKAYMLYQDAHGALPDRQLAYLFLNEAMELLEPGGVLCMLQQYNFLYNQKSVEFRRKFIERWDVREILDFISVRGLFRKGSADTKVVVVAAEANEAPEDRQILHATFRRTGRVDAQRGFDIDYYDMHWLPRELVLSNDGVWRSDLLGGGRVLAFADRLRDYRTIGQFANGRSWDFGEGFVEGKRGVDRPASHIIGMPLLSSEALSDVGIDRSAISVAPKKPIEGPRTEARFAPPMFLVREHMDLHHALWTEYYMTYKNPIVGFCAPLSDLRVLKKVERWFSSNLRTLRAFAAVTSTRLFSRKATAVSSHDIVSLPFPSGEQLNLSPTEQVIVDDIVDYYRDLVRLGEDSLAMSSCCESVLGDFNECFTRQINAVYKKNKLRELAPQSWPGFVCQPYVFRNGEIDWGNTHELKEKLNALLREKRGVGLQITRVSRVYDGACIYLLKPDRLRYWLRSVALRDADETLADLWNQGF